MTRTPAGLLALGLALSLAPDAAAQTLDAVELVAFRAFEPGLPPLQLPYGFDAYIEGSGITSATLQPLTGGAPPVSFVEDGPGLFFIESNYASLAELRADWPTGPYLLSVNNGAIVEVLTHAPAEPKGAPTILAPAPGATGVSLPLTVSWTDCSLCGAGLAFVALQDVNDDDELVAEFLPATATTWSPPPGVLQPGETYIFDLSFGNADFLGTLTSGVEYLSAFSYDTTIEFTIDSGVTALETVRLGSPPNPDVLRPGLTGAPSIGSIWSPWIDHTSFAPTATFDLVFVDLGGPLNIPTSIGTLLCLVPAASQIFATVPGAPFAISVPSNPAFVGMTACSQGAAYTAGVGLQLTNALDLVIGQ